MVISSIERKEFKLYVQYRGVLYFWDETDKEYGEYFMQYCPFCGDKLPQHLYASVEYKNALEKAVGKEFCNITEDEIPEEFKTDEWWKKRGV